MRIPGHVSLYRIESHSLQFQQAILPMVRVNTEAMHGSGEDSKPLAVQHKGLVVVCEWLQDYASVLIRANCNGTALPGRQLIPFIQSKITSRASCRLPTWQ